MNTNDSTTNVITALYHGLIIFCLGLQFDYMTAWMSTLSFMGLMWIFLPRNFRQSHPPPRWLLWTLFIVGSAVLIFQFRLQSRIFLIQAVVAMGLILQLFRPYHYRSALQSGLLGMGALAMNIVIGASGFKVFICFVVLFGIIFQFVLSHQFDLKRSTFAKFLKGLAKTLVQTVPIVIGLFIVLPSVLPVQSPQNQTRFSVGFSGELNPGVVAELSQSNQPAFVLRSENLSRLASLYWRGMVLEESSGLTWTALTQTFQTDRFQPDEEMKVIEVTYETDFGSRIFSPSNAVGLKSRGYFTKLEKNDAGIYSVKKRQLGSLQYHAYVVDDREVEARDPPISAHLEVDSANANGYVSNIVGDIASQAANRIDFIHKLGQWFQQNDFYYTLNPGRTPSLEHFLKQKRGYCEHYAAAFATMLRLNQIPSRVVIGFQGGERNIIDDSVLVRSSDAHAWVEAYLDDEGVWKRVDPTAYIAPDRLLYGGQKYHALQSAWFRHLPHSWQENGWVVLRFFQSGRDYILSVWNRFIQWLARWYQDSIFSVVDEKIVSLVLLLMFYLFMRRMIFQRPDPLSQCFTSFEKHLKTQRQFHETEWDYYQRVSSGPFSDESLKAFITAYCRLKYGRSLVTRRELSRLRLLVKAVR